MANVSSNRPGMETRRWILLTADLATGGAFVGLCFAFLARADVETTLLRTFPDARRDAFDGLNRILPAFVLLLIVWTAISVAFIICRCGKPLWALVCGPLIAAGLVVLSTDFADPSWFIICALLSIGFLVGIVVSLAWRLASLLRQHL